MKFVGEMHPYQSISFCYYDALHLIRATNWDIFIGLTLAEQYKKAYREEYF